MAAASFERERAFAAATLQELGRLPRAPTVDAPAARVILAAAPASAAHSHGTHRRTLTGACTRRGLTGCAGAFVARGEDGHWSLAVRTLDPGTTYTAHVRAGDTVAALHTLLLAASGVAVADQRLTCEGHVLVPTTRLRDLEAALARAPLFLVVRPRLVSSPDPVPTPAAAATAASVSQPATATPVGTDTSQAKRRRAEDEHAAAAAAAAEDAAFWAGVATHLAKRVPAADADAFVAQTRTAFAALVAQQPPQPHA
jgi:hypothetical protein